MQSRTEVRRRRERAPDQRTAASERRNRAKGVREVSDKYLGVKNGTKNKKLKVIPKSEWDAEMRKVAERIKKETGKEPIFVIGDIELNVGKTTKTAKGAFLTDSPRSFSGRYVRHVLKEHGNALIEMLRGQMYMSRDSIKIALSQLQEGKGRIIQGTFSERGMPSILTEIPVNGYTLYAEEPLELRAGTELEGRTMYMTPTSTTALTWQKPNSIPQRRGGASYSSIPGKDRIVNGILAGKDGTPTKLHFLTTDGKPYSEAETYGAVLLCNNRKAARTVSGKKLNTQQGYAAITNPCIVSADNPVINKEDIRNGEVAQRIAEIKEKGFDAIVMDYKNGDNYAVLVFDKSKIISEAEYRAMQKQSAAAGTEKGDADSFAVDIDEEAEAGGLQGEVVPAYDRDMAEQAAKAQGYPVVEGVQIVPNKTYVRCTDGGRSNYGLVIGKADRVCTSEAEGFTAPAPKASTLKVQKLSTLVLPK